MAFLFFARSSTLALCLGSLISPVYSSTVHMRFNRQTGVPFETGLDNDYMHGLYTINVSIGHPPQTVAVQLDTGSADLWAFGPNACSLQNASACIGGSYDMTKSNTSYLLQSDGFGITYATPGSFVYGDFVSDDVSVGGVTAKGQIFGVATSSAHESSGILGIGFDSNEANYTHGGTAYPNLISSLVRQGAINRRAYSVWLDSPDATEGSILFGGFDTSKYTGELIALPMVPDSNGGQSYQYFTVEWTFVGVTNGDGQFQIEQNLALPVVLDTGSSWMAVPQNYYNALMNLLGAVNTEQFGYVVTCESLQNSNSSIVFGFGGQYGPQITVPYSRFSHGIYDKDGNSATDTNGDDICQVAVQLAGDGETILLGDTFLRSTYCLYDLDAKMIYMAQASYDTDNSDVQAVDDNKAVASRTASVSGVVQTATRLPGGEASVTALPSVYTLGGKVFTATATDISVTGTGTAASPSSTDEDSGSAKLGGLSAEMVLAVATIVCVLVQFGGA